MNRPKITEKARNQYLENPELFNYTQELGIYADALEASLAKDGEMLTFMNAKIELLKSKLSERQATEKTSDTDKSEALNMHVVNASFLPNCTRVEVIDNAGRSYVNWTPANKVRVMMQDDNRTLKVFII